ncbi:MAG TPA: carbohydrate porin [Thiobacillaceae bacterium]|nr:carbohydrate porin [Thiobacillaceae bacterium]HNU64184.1 carbohydrate porin [Thiobacillaceae bacterium]
MPSAFALRPRVLPWLLSLAALPALAQPLDPEVARLLQDMQARLDRLEARNAELERRLAEAANTGREAPLQARVEGLAHELEALRQKSAPLDKLRDIQVGASLTMVAQRARGGGVHASELTSRGDLEVELPGGAIGDAQGRLFAHLRAGDGGGVVNNAFATSNATAFGNEPRPVLMQAWYQLDLPMGGSGGQQDQLELTVGKIDPFVFFDGNALAADESEDFLNLAFVHNPLLDAGGDVGVGAHGASPGLRLAYVHGLSDGHRLTASLGMFGAGPGADFQDSFNRPFTIAQLEYAGKTWNGREGAYRLYAWNNSRANDQVNLTLDTDGDGIADQGVRERHAGWGLSLDQQVGEQVGLFARYGHSTRGVLAFDRGLTLGGQLSGDLWGRADDRLGLAIGSLRPGSAYKSAGNGSQRERIYELFYAWRPNDYLQLSPSVQYISHAAGGQGNVTVWGLRAKASY